jgi:hypothetical protein
MVARTLTDDDIDAIADRVVALIVSRLIPAAPTVYPPTPVPVTVPNVVKLAYTKKELAEQLSMSETTIWRLEHRGLLRSVLADEAHSRRDVERYLNECEERIL